MLFQTAFRKGSFLSVEILCIYVAYYVCLSHCPLGRLTYYNLCFCKFRWNFIVLVCISDDSWGWNLETCPDTFQHSCVKGQLSASGGMATRRSPLRQTCLALTSPPSCDPCPPHLLQLLGHGEAGLTVARWQPGEEGQSGLGGTPTSLQEAAFPRAHPAWLRGWMRPVPHARMPVYLRNNTVLLETAQKLHHLVFSQPQTSESYVTERGVCDRCGCWEEAPAGDIRVVVWLTVMSQCACLGFDFPEQTSRSDPSLPVLVHRLNGLSLIKRWLANGHTRDFSWAHQSPPWDSLHCIWKSRVLYVAKLGGQLCALSGQGPETQPTPPVRGEDHPAER